MDQLLVVALVLVGPFIVAVFGSLFIAKLLRSPTSTDRCAACNYDMRGLPQSVKCPECAGARHPRQPTTGGATVSTVCNVFAVACLLFAVTAFLHFIKQDFSFMQIISVAIILLAPGMIGFFGVACIAVTRTPPKFISRPVCWLWGLGSALGTCVTLPLFTLTAFHPSSGDGQAGFAYLAIPFLAQYGATLGGLLGIFVAKR